MRQFDVYPNPNASMRSVAPFVVILSSHYLPELTEVVVAPLFATRKTTLQGTEVRVVVDDADLLVVLSGLAAVRSGSLRRRLGNLLAHEDDIRRALDRLFTGF